MYMLNMVIILIVMYCNVVTAIDKIPTYLLRFNIALGRGSRRGKNKRTSAQAGGEAALVVSRTRRIREDFEVLAEQQL